MHLCISIKVKIFSMKIHLLERREIAAGSRPDRGWILNFNFFSFERNSVTLK